MVALNTFLILVLVKISFANELLLLITAYSILKKANILKKLRKLVLNYNTDFKYIFFRI